MKKQLWLSPRKNKVWKKTKGIQVAKLKLGLKRRFTTGLWSCSHHSTSMWSQFRHLQPAHIYDCHRHMITICNPHRQLLTKSVGKLKGSHSHVTLHLMNTADKTNNWCPSLALSQCYTMLLLRTVLLKIEFLIPVVVGKWRLHVLVNTGRRN